MGSSAAGHHMSRAGALLLSKGWKSPHVALIMQMETSTSHWQQTNQPCCVASPGAAGAEPRAAAQKPAAGAERIVAQGLDAAEAHRAVRGAVILSHCRQRTRRLVEGTRAARGLKAAQFLDMHTRGLTISSASAMNPAAGAVRWCSTQVVCNGLLSALASA